jgi:peptidyl-prolyl cis-trans isomerase D
VLLRVTDVKPAAVRPFEEVAGEIKRQIALERARTEIDRVHDEVEDLRASAKPLAEVAKEKNLNLVQIPAVDQTGRDKAGHPVQNLPEAQALIQAAFASDIGVDNEPLHTRDGGYVWYDVTAIEPAREKSLDEVRGEVERQWRENEVSERLAEKARQFVQRLDKGEAPEAIASETGLEAKTATDLARRTAKDDLTADAVTRIFATPVGKAGSAPNGSENRAVFKVTGASVPPLVTTTQQAEQIENRVREGMADTLLAEYIAQAQSEIPVRINETLLQTALGGV